MKPYLAQTKAELLMTLRRGESLLVTFGIPVGILLFFSYVDVLPNNSEVDLVPAAMALAIMGAAMVSLGIATGYERHYLVLKRLGGTPLGKHRLVAAKMTSVLSIEIIQIAVIYAAAFAAGIPASLHPARLIAGILLATAAFAGIGLAMAGRLRAETNLASVNALFLYLMLVGGVVVSVERLPGALSTVAAVLPAASAVQIMEWAAGVSPFDLASVLIIGAWGLGATAVAALTFRWE